MTIWFYRPLGRDTMSETQQWGKKSAKNPNPAWHIITSVQLTALRKTVSSAMLVRMAKYTRNVRSCRMRKESHIIKLEKSSRRGNFQIFIYWHSLKTFSLPLNASIDKVFRHIPDSLFVTMIFIDFQNIDSFVRRRIKIENFLFIFFQVIVSAQFLFLVNTTRHIVSEQSPSIGKRLNAKEKPIHAKDQCESLVALSSIRKVLNSSS